MRRARTEGEACLQEQEQELFGRCAGPGWRERLASRSKSRSFQQQKQKLPGSSKHGRRLLASTLAGRRLTAQVAVLAHPLRCGSTSTPPPPAQRICTVDVHRGEQGITASRSKAGRRTSGTVCPNVLDA